MLTPSKYVKQGKGVTTPYPTFVFNVVTGMGSECLYHVVLLIDLC